MSATFPQSELLSDPTVQCSGSAMRKSPPEKNTRSGPLADLIFGVLAKGAALLTLGILLAFPGLSLWLPSMMD